MMVLVDEAQGKRYEVIYTGNGELAIVKEIEWLYPMKEVSGGAFLKEMLDMEKNLEEIHAQANDIYLKVQLLKQGAN
jgi:hypothetical protein